MILKARKLTARKYNIKYGNEDKLNRLLRKSTRKDGKGEKYECSDKMMMIAVT